MIFDTINSLAQQRVPFLFISNFQATKVEAIPLDQLKDHDIEFSIQEQFVTQKHHYTLRKKALSYEEYVEKFDAVIENIKAGNTYLLNLTQATPVMSDLSLDEIYRYANAHYKLRYKDQFVCFSPEKFVQIHNNTIDTFPMKGTIDASIPDAHAKILADTKEMAEHVMVVDLLRNDLSIVAKDVGVEKFRYITSIQTGKKELLQVSSHIRGSVGENWHERLGDILKALLPAGSISGTPKAKTLELIEEIEGYDRGYFSGVFGLYDGERFDSGVMIRFIEKSFDGYLYKSGGGITLDSSGVDEYRELLDKIYLP